MKSQISMILNGNPGDEVVDYFKYGLTDNALSYLSSGDAAAFIKAFGYQLLDSYDEAGNLSAMWSLTLDEPTDTKHFEEFCMQIQRNFLTERSISEVCEFFSDEINSRIDPGVKLNVKTSIFGYCKPASTAATTKFDIEPWSAKFYRTEDALQRNRVRTSYGLRDYKGLQVGFANEQQKAQEAYAKIPSPVAPDETCILGLQEVLRQLFVLNAYDQSGLAGPIQKQLLDYWGKFDDLRLQKTTSMSKDGVTSGEEIAAWLGQGVNTSQFAKKISNLSARLQVAIEGAERTMRKLRD